jgi:hypothetical protein
MLDCTCGETEIVATREIRQRRTIAKEGLLDEEHGINWADGDHTVVNQLWEEIDSQTDCDQCVANAEDEDWESIVFEEWEVDEESEYFEVRCTECDHEVEIGWSHPGRGGHVWPCEDTDFNPWLSWPEPRFVPAWRRRGWLRPTKIEEVARLLQVSPAEAKELISSGALPRHPTRKELASDLFAIADYLEQARKAGN